ncbi:hypothetical protein XNW1_1890002 [Xenorhabdus nematophila str. Websteri]|nr:hypothetical protein XNW1_1890002 [Xenorhabdus nematophila str. Websteri]
MGQFKWGRDMCVPRKYGDKPAEHNEISQLIVCSP